MYIIAKDFRKQGSYAYKCKTVDEARCVPGTLDAMRGEHTQIVLLKGLDVYSEYKPYTFVEQLPEFVKIASTM